MKPLFGLAVASLTLLNEVSGSPFGSETTINTRTLEQPPKPDCEPKFSLVGATSEGVNVQGAPFKAAIGCSTLQPDKVFVFVNGQEYHDFQVSGSAISFSKGLSSTTEAVLGIIAADTNGYPFVSSFSLRFKSLSTPNPARSRRLVTSAQKPEDAACAACGNCDTCPGYPMCKDTCKVPQPHQCDFYQTCVEDSVPCAGDRDSYAINYGLKNCQKFEKNLSLFSDRGNQFIWGTMNCLQNKLVPVVSDCSATCQSIHDAAFGSHAECYIANDFCSLKCGDYLAELYTVGLDLFSKDAIKSVFQTAGGCLANIEQVIEQGACMNNVLKGIVLTILRGLAL